MTDFWRKCSACKGEIAYGASHYVCSVSTCNQKRTGLVFCSVECWDIHLGVVRHRADAGAVEQRAPTREQWMDSGSVAAGRRAYGNAPATRIRPSEKEIRPMADASDTDILVVASKVKKYIRDTSGMNTSASTMEALTAWIRFLCDRAVERAEESERKTVMDRDVAKVPD